VFEDARAVLGEISAQSTPANLYARNYVQSYITALVSRVPGRNVLKTTEHELCVVVRVSRVYVHITFNGSYVVKGDVDAPCRSAFSA